MTTRQASCSCGQLRVTCSGEPVRISMCHCLACQKRTGSPFGVQARFHRAQVAIEGQAKAFTRIGDEGNRSTSHFCLECGSTLYWILSGEPDLIAVAVGNFADPTLPAPGLSFYERRRHAWVIVPDGPEMQRFD